MFGQCACSQCDAQRAGSPLARQSQCQQHVGGFRVAGLAGRAGRTGETLHIQVAQQGIAVHALEHEAGVVRQAQAGMPGQARLSPDLAAEDDTGISSADATAVSQAAVASARSAAARSIAAVRDARSTCASRKASAIPAM